MSFGVRTPATFEQLEAHSMLGKTGASISPGCCKCSWKVCGCGTLRIFPHPGMGGLLRVPRCLIAIWNYVASCRWILIGCGPIPERVATEGSLRFPIVPLGHCFWEGATLQDIEKVSASIYKRTFWVATSPFCRIDYFVDEGPEWQGTKTPHLLLNRSLFDDRRFFFDGNAWNLQDELLRVVPLLFFCPSSHNHGSVETVCVWKGHDPIGDTAIFHWTMITGGRVISSLASQAVNWRDTPPPPRSLT